MSGAGQGSGCGVAQPLEVSTLCASRWPAVAGGPLPPRPVCPASEPNRSRTNVTARGTAYGSAPPNAVQQHVRPPAEAATVPVMQAAGEGADPAARPLSLARPSWKQGGGCNGMRRRAEAGEGLLGHAWRVIFRPIPSSWLTFCGLRPMPGQVSRPGTGTRPSVLGRKGPARWRSSGGVAGGRTWS